MEISISLFCKKTTKICIFLQFLHKNRHFLLIFALFLHFLKIKKAAVHNCQPPVIFSTTKIYS